MVPPTFSETTYEDSNFYFHPVEYPKDEYIQYDVNCRVLSKFNLNNWQNSNDIYFSEVYSFILQNIISKYDELISCNMLHEDIEGNPAIEFFIKFDGNLSFKQRKGLTYNVLEDIYNFCIDSGFPQVFKEIPVFLIK